MKSNAACEAKKVGTLRAGRVSLTDTSGEWLLCCVVWTREPATYLMRGVAGFWLGVLLGHDSGGIFRPQTGWNYLEKGKGGCGSGWHTKVRRDPEERCRSFLSWGGLDIRTCVHIFLALHAQGLDSEWIWIGDLLQDGMGVRS